MQRFDVDYRGRQLTLVIDGRDLVLSLNGVERKRRSRDGVECVYVWTNVELEWEEHHFIEARWWPARARLSVTSNGGPVLDVNVAT